MCKIWRKNKSSCFKALEWAPGRLYIDPKHCICILCSCVGWFPLRPEWLRSDCTAAQLPGGGAREITWLEKPLIVTNTNTNNCLWQMQLQVQIKKLQIQIQWLKKPLDCHNNQFDFVASVYSVASVCCQNEGFLDPKTFHFDNKLFHLLPKPICCKNILNCFKTPWMWQQLTRNLLNVTTIDLKPIECDNNWVETTWMWQKLIWQLLMESNNLLCIHLKDLHCDNKRFELTLKQLVRVDFYNHLLLILPILWL